MVKQKQRKKLSYRDTISEIVSLIKEAKEEKLQEFFTFAGRFSLQRYSFFNQWLIFSQRPNATFVAGLKAWNKMGRKVKKGEKGIAILAPIIVKEVDEDGEEVEKLVGFKTAYVWDISQTEGKPLPPDKLFKPIDGVEIGYESIVDEWLERLTGVKTLNYVEKPLHGARGCTDGTTIFVEASLPEAHKLKTFFHELCHAVFHFSEAAANKSREVKELEAEATAMILCGSFDIDTSSYSINYMAAWSDLDEKEIVKAIKAAFAYARFFRTVCMKTEED
ncbi:ArdC-like ssDNA-binding domain-containing protein [Desulfurobacterium sp.]